MVTDTAFKKSRLGKLILEKILPGTSKNWPYHTDLLVFCLKFKLSLVCEYLNYCYNITNDCWTIPGKSKQGGLRSYFLLKNPWIFEVYNFTIGNSGQNKVPLVQVQGQKPRLMKMQHDFLITPKNSTSFSVDP